MSKGYPRLRPGVIAKLEIANRRELTRMLQYGDEPVRRYDATVWGHTTDPDVWYMGSRITVETVDPSEIPQILEPEEYRICPENGIYDHTEGRVQSHMTLEEWDEAQAFLDELEHGEFDLAKDLIAEEYDVTRRYVVDHFVGARK